jgi:hypothetical protein
VHLSLKFDLLETKRYDINSKVKEHLGLMIYIFRRRMFRLQAHLGPRNCFSLRVSSTRLKIKCLGIKS